jgi:hypothetical protein
MALRRHRDGIALLALLPLLLPAQGIGQERTPLEQHREHVRAGGPASLTLSGQVDGAHEGVIYTTIAPSPEQPLVDQDVLQVSIGGRVLQARYFSPATYRRLAADPSAIASLDVEVLCTSDPSGFLALAASGGDLREVLHLESPASVVVVRP